MRNIAALTGLSILALSTSAVLAQEIRFDIEVADDDLETVLENSSLLIDLKDEAEPPSAQDWVAAARADYRRLLTGLYAEGYYGGTISILVNGREAAGIAPLDAPDRVDDIAIRVNQGPRFAFGRTEIAPLAPDTELPESFATGEVARAEAVRAAARAGVDAWQAVGHAKAEVGDQEIVADHPSQRLAARVRLAPGPRLRFGPLAVTGNEAVRVERIRAIADFPTGTVYDPEDLEFSATRLRRSGAFDSVAFIESEEIGPDASLPFELVVSESLPRRVGFGAELSTVEGLGLSAFWLHRNLLGGAERFRVEGEISGIEGEVPGVTGSGGADYRLGASFNRPATFRADVDLFAEAEIKRENEIDYRLDQIRTEIGLQRYVNDRLSYSAAIGVLRAREETDARTREYTLLTLPLDATYDRRDVALDATEGFFIDAEITPFVGVTGIGDGVRLYADGRAYRSFGAGGRVTLAARAQLGSVLGAGISETPADFLFYSGGGGTVRGHEYQSLGVTTIRDFGDGPVEVRSGGRSFAGAQLEARIDVTDSIGAVGFYDIGYVERDGIPDGSGDWQAGAGAGIRYATPIGPVRLDLATPVTGDDAYDSVQLYIGIGQAF
ncbi:autotransporter assembly complex protein TamA [Limimaricola pyoseonensis]|uniref:Autotransporter secretion outer membrane protein TamA n=1 Tax=Limimaricola pyoseonensis TaxID=521013 RepID=A0A1G7CH60_9RHOB|nr:BamA/TamA family outer membrane protein [Limimaricola pyoseonensis]SDE38639.1 autotransporter secretion outer membrane protein TamA [Limimaricola pyoseonensis]